MKNRVTHLASALLATALVTTSASADGARLLFRLLQDDGYCRYSGDRFGGHVAISGSRAIVRSSRNRDCEFLESVSSGPQLNLFDVNTGHQVSRLRPHNVINGERVDAPMGTAIAMDGSRVVVSSPRNRTPGSAFVFDVMTGEQLFKLVQEDGLAGDGFGNSLAISEGRAIIGAPTKDGDPNDINTRSIGAAYIFDLTTGEQLFKLTSPDGLFNDQFGISVAISGDLALVGAYLDNDNGLDSGSVYVFNATTGQFLRKLHPDDAAANERFGGTVALSGTTAVIGGRYPSVIDIFFIPRIRSLYAFDVTTGEQLYTRSFEQHSFTTHIAYMVGDNRLVLRDLDRDELGRFFYVVSFYDLTTGNFLLKVIPEDPMRFSSFSVDGSMLLVGAPGEDLDPEHAPEAGAAYIFDITAPCPQDLDGDATVGAPDITILLGAWNTPTADLNNDGTTNARDLSLLLGAWGPC